MAIKVRATRAYLAGFGTSGSLLAGAALMFLLASAIVAFRGWPQIAGQNPIANVAVARLTVPPSSATARILRAPGVSRAVAAALHGTPSAGAAARTPAAGGQQGGTVDGVTTGTVALRAPGPGHSGPTPVLPGLPAVCAGNVCVPTVPPPNVQGVGTTASQALSQAGQQAGSAVSNASNSAASAVSPVSSSAAGTVKKIGHGTATGVTGAATTVGNTLTTGAISTTTTHLATSLAHH